MPDHLSLSILSSYWNSQHMVTNILIILHLLGALGVGIIMGYERSFHGRAAGMRTHVMVCMTSTLLTVANAFPEQWYGGLFHVPNGGDPTRVIQGIMTGMGFLGAGIIMRDGMSIRGLSTAAFLWLTAGVGVLIGLGFYGGAIAATVISVLVMSGFRRLEDALPHHSRLKLFLAYPSNSPASRTSLVDLAQSHGYEIIHWSFRHDSDKRIYTYDLILLSEHGDRSALLVDDLHLDKTILEYQVEPARN